MKSVKKLEMNFSLSVHRVVREITELGKSSYRLVESKNIPAVSGKIPGRSLQSSIVVKNS